MAKGLAMLQTWSLAVAGISGLAIAAEAFWSQLNPTTDPAVKAHALDWLIVFTTVGIVAFVVWAIVQHRAEQSRLKEAANASLMLENILQGLRKGLPSPAAIPEVAAQEPTTFRGQVIQFVTEVRTMLASYKEPMSDDDKYSMIMSYVTQFSKRYFAIKHHLENLLGHHKVQPLYSLPLPMSKDAIVRTTNLLESLLSGVPADLPAYPPELDTQYGL